VLTISMPLRIAARNAFDSKEGPLVEPHHPTPLLLKLRPRDGIARPRKPLELRGFGEPHRRLGEPVERLRDKLGIGAENGFVGLASEAFVKEGFSFALFVKSPPHGAFCPVAFTGAPPTGAPAPAQRVS
jgi:hypothetical protein